MKRILHLVPIKNIVFKSSYNGFKIEIRRLLQLLTDQFFTQPNFPSHCISPSSTACLWLCLCLWLFVCVCACLSVTSEAVTDDKRLRARLATRNWQEDTYSTLPMAKRRQILQIFNKYIFQRQSCENSDVSKVTLWYVPLWQNQIDREWNVLNMLRNSLTKFINMAIFLGKYQNCKKNMGCLCVTVTVTHKGKNSVSNGRVCTTFSSM